MLVSVAICTFRRPKQLDALLEILSRLAPETPEFELIVVDNDPENSALPIIHKWQGHFGVRLISDHIPVPNISLARNRTFALARTPWIALIDDDETPSPDWLITLLRVASQFSADVVFGPVIPVFDGSCPEWLRSGGSFHRPRFTTGTRIDERNARTGNALVNLTRVRTIFGDLSTGACPFNSEYGRTGGEDSLFFRHLMREKLKMVWCDEANVFENVPRERANVRWVLQRAFRTGFLYIKTELAHLRGYARFKLGLKLQLRAMVQCVLALLLTAAHLPINRATALRWLRTMVNQAGKLSFIFGFLRRSNTDHYGADTTVQPQSKLG